MEKKKIFVLNLDLYFIFLSLVSRTPSPVSTHSKSDSRSQSPASELAVELNQKDSPTPDRDSLHIDVVAGSGAEEAPMNRSTVFFFFFFKLICIKFKKINFFSVTFKPP